MFAFALAALLLIMVPGPDQALTTRNALAGGRRGGLLTVAGGVMGLTVHASAAAFGLSALLLASATAFTMLKVVGAVYLVYLGIQTLRAARRGSAHSEVSVAAPGRRLAYLRQGFLSNALNPKVGLFFVTFLPQFLSADAGSPRTQALLLSAIFATLYVAWFSLYVVLVERLGRFLRRPTVKARIEQVTAFVLIGMAVRLTAS